MPFTKDGCWVPNLAPKQFEVFNCYKRYLLVSGPRKSAKTWACQAKIIRHAWEVKGARVGVFTKTIKNAKVGVWDALYRMAGEWAQNMDGFEISKPMSTDATTRMQYFRIRNRHGAESEFQLHSLENESEIESKMKGTEFSFIFVSELTNFKTPKIFTFTVPQLRGLGVSKKEQMWMADTNPDEDEGDSFWAYKLFYEERVQENHKMPSYQKQIGLIEFTIDDNIFLDEDEKEELEAMYAHDDDLFQVYVKGKWIQTSRDSFFVGIFSPNQHIIGNGEELEVEDDTVELLGGWDPGDVNMAFHVCEKVGRGNTTFWKHLDELVCVGQNIPLEEYTLAVCEVMDEWEQRIGRKVRWKHWSDPSAVERYRSAAGTWDQMLIYNASQGRIKIDPAPKFSGSARLRVQLARQLLSENRWWISDRCPRLIDSLRGGLKKGKNRDKFIRDNPHKHPFDSATYPILAESSFDIQLGSGPKIGHSSAFSCRI